MDLAFGDKNIRCICEDENRAVELYGTTIAGALQDCLAAMSAAISLNDLTILGLELMTDNKLRINILDNYWITFCSNNRRFLRDPENRIDMNEVNRVKILSIGLQSHK